MRIDENGRSGNTIFTFSTFASLADFFKQEKKYNQNGFHVNHSYARFFRKSTPDGVFYGGSKRDMDGNGDAYLWVR